ncbi:MAG: hypothetical protein JSV73_00750 [Flavobacteriaceae bacterium]|nr:MAG: hypothetical protein JSV73_00750 [Flavobacteriaceae bacterium]
MRNVFLIVFLFICSKLTGHTVEPTAGVEENIIQIELESLYVVETSNVEEVYTWSIPSTLIRYGVFKSMEFQLLVPFYREKKLENDLLMSSRVLFDKLQLGFSLDIFKENGIIPETALMLRTLIPVYNTNTSQVGQLISLNCSNSISDKFLLNYNLGFVLERDASFSYYIGNLTYNLSERLHFFTEFFGDLYHPERSEHIFNLGGGINFGKSFTLDLSFAKGIDHDMFYYGGVLTYFFKV